MPSSSGDLLLTVENLNVSFDTRSGLVRAVDGMNLTIRKGETLCLVGESGCGKSVTGLALMRLIDAPGRISAESRIDFEGRCSISEVMRSQWFFRSQ
jgi:ABC-type dipeptide/oligopeptide/nickel transport system ATPase component